MLNEAQKKVFRAAVITELYTWVTRDKGKAKSRIDFLESEMEKNLDSYDDYTEFEDRTPEIEDEEDRIKIYNDILSELLNLM